MKTNMSHAPLELEGIQRDGVDVHGRHVNIKFWLGGDLKFITAMLALCGNSSIYPCPFCLVCDRKDKQQLYFTRAQLQGARVEDRTIFQIMRHAHYYDGADYI